MNIKFPFKKSFLHRVYWYSCFGVLLPIFVCAGIELKTTPKKIDRFAIFIGADLKPTSTISYDINSYFTDYNNKKITVSACDPSNSFFPAHYGSEALLCDVIILPKRAFSQVDLTLYIDVQSDNQYYDETNYINEDGKHLGIYFGNGDSTPWSDDVSYFEEDYYLFISSNSVHAQYFQDTYKDDQVMNFLNQVLKWKR